MEKVLELRRQIAALVDEMRGLADSDKEDDIARFGQLKADVEGMRAKEQRMIEAEGLRPEDFGARPELRETNAEPQTKDWQSFGEYLQAVCFAGMPEGRTDGRLLEQRATGMSEGVPADGGFMVQTDFVSELLRRTYETGELARRCRKIPVSAKANGLKINAVAETSRVDGSRWGGVQAYWLAEAAQKTASAPKLRRINLELKKLAGLCYLTDELIEDAAALESVVTQAFSEEFAFKIDDGIFRGDGAGKPLGLLNAPATVEVSKEPGQAAATVVYENILAMWARMWAPSRRNAVWLINQDIEPQLYTMSLAVGTGGAPVYLPAGGASAAPYGTLMGRPVIPIEACSTLGTAGDIVLADLSQYLWIDKGGIQQASSIHVKFVYDETVLRFVYRCDGQPWWVSALTPYKGSNTLSPFVTLEERS